ncbi:hypothetical protein T08_950 [Trichinella sp. T8]|nr:hypothetical protein T08_950 [Trichinella sp. T8]
MIRQRCGDPYLHNAALEIEYKCTATFYKLGKDYLKI